MQYVVSLFKIFDVFVLVLVSRFQITFYPGPGHFVDIYLLVIRSLQPLIKLIRSSRYYELLLLDISICLYLLRHQ